MGTSQLLQPGFHFRHPILDDAMAITGLIRATEITEQGSPEFMLEDLLSDWHRPDFNPSLDAWMVVAPDGEGCAPGPVVGYEEISNRANHARLDGDGYVHPAYLGLGIGTALLRVMEARACQHTPQAPPDLCVSIRNGVYGGDLAACQLHEHEGYQPIRYFWRMQIDLQEVPPAPEWPPNVILRPFDPQQDSRAVHRAFDEAFRDHWGHSPRSLEEWQRRNILDDRFEPSLWFIAWQGDQVAGGALCSYKQEAGYIGTLGIRRPWRRAGLGLAVLRHAFREFFRRGTRTILLNVDAQNPTGATRLYERAGMHVAHEFVVYEKVLRPGRSVETEAGEP